MPIASDNNGNAWVANAFTVGANNYPTAIYIQNNDYQACAADASTFSTSATWLPWATWAGARDACIKNTLDFNAIFGASNNPPMLGMTITGISLDANMDPWFVLVDGATTARAPNNPNVIIVHYNSAIDTLTQYVGPCSVCPLSCCHPACLPWSPSIRPDHRLDPRAKRNPPAVPRVYGPTPTYGGNGFVIDNNGVGWSGSGTLDSSVFYIDTNNPSTTGVVAVTHDTNVITTDMHGHIWAAGAAGVTKIRAGTKKVAWTLDLTTVQNSCDTSPDDCCTNGGYDTGLIPGRSTGRMYIANQCYLGQVISLDVAATSASAASSTAVTHLLARNYPGSINAINDKLFATTTDGATNATAYLEVGSALHLPLSAECHPLLKRRSASQYTTAFV
jgi:hypothetical protein